MGNDKVGLKLSVIIPAANEENFLPKAVTSLKNQTISRDDYEIIVSVNGSKDKTFECAKELADQIVFSEQPLTPSLARNRGAEIAKGDVLVFLDADSTLSPNALERIAQLCGKNKFGSVRCAPDVERFSAVLFMAFKNFTNKSGLYKGVGGGLFFTDAHTFNSVGGFDGTKRVAEFQELTARLRQDGSRYVFIKDVVATTSVRRFEKSGFAKTIWFWIRWWFSWRISLLIGKESRVAREYHE